jgi:hypothetical protein
VTWQRVYHAAPEPVALAALYSPRGAEPEPVAVLAIDHGMASGDRAQVLFVDEDGQLYTADLGEIVIVDHRVEAAIRAARDGFGS